MKKKELSSNELKTQQDPAWGLQYLRDLVNQGKLAWEIGDEQFSFTNKNKLKLHVYRDRNNFDLDNPDRTGETQKEISAVLQEFRYTGAKDPFIWAYRISTPDMEKEYREVNVHCAFTHNPGRFLLKDTTD